MKNNDNFIPLINAKLLKIKSSTGTLLACFLKCKYFYSFVYE
jgi:hypothetical protein